MDLLCVEEAAVTGDYGLALQAFILNPQIPSGENAKRVLDELLIAHKIAFIKICISRQSHIRLRCTNS